MTKQIISLNHDFIIESRFKAKTDYVNGKTVVNWVDETKTIAHGKDVVENIYALIPEYDSNGYGTGRLIQLSFRSSDIKELAKKIEEIESPERQSHPGDDLPF